MKFLIAVVLLIAAVSAVPRISPEETTAFGYHAKIGIPRAQEIKEYEELLAKDPSKIIGGDAAVVGQIPFQAGLLISLVGISGQSVCGAVLISNNRLVTAAHCWYDGSYQAFQFEVILGTRYFFTGGTRVTATNVEAHADWNPRTITNDIAMINLDSSLTFSDAIRPVTLPRNYLNQGFTGWTATVSGFGRTSDQQSGIPITTFLSYVDVPVIANSVCRVAFGSAIIESSICTSGANRRSACSGDSGGPLFVTANGEDILIGLVSFGSGLGCEWGFPNAYARVTSFMSWIDARM